MPERCFIASMIGPGPFAFWHFGIGERTQRHDEKVAEVFCGMDRDKFDIHSEFSTLTADHLWLLVERTVLANEFEKNIFCEMCMKKLKRHRDLIGALGDIA